MYRFFVRTSKQVVGRVLVATIKRQLDQQLSTPSANAPTSTNQPAKPKPNNTLQYK